MQFYSGGVIFVSDKCHIFYEKNENTPLTPPILKIKMGGESRPSPIFVL